MPRGAQESWQGVRSVLPARKRARAGQDSLKVTHIGSRFETVVGMSASFFPNGQFGDVLQTAQGHEATVGWVVSIDGR
jgi:hypothetical protein